MQHWFGIKSIVLEMAIGKDVKDSKNNGTGS